MNKIFDRNLFGSNDKSADFTELALSLASPDKIRSWSFGEVRLPETINYRTFKPEPDGLFCAKIFGPIKDYECLCGKYKRMKFRNVICEKCQVEVTVERVRRERMGHITLACPVAHILFFKSLPSRIGLMLNLTMRDIERILYFEAYVVLDPKRVEELERGRLLNTDEYQKMRETYGLTSFDVGIGAEGLRDFLKKIDLDEDVDFLSKELEEANSETKRKKIFKRLKLIKNFRAADLRPEWMILETLPVLPPNLRPLVQLDGIRFTTSDLNELYRRVINRNNRLRKLIDLAAPEIIINNEKRMLQEAVDSLLDNGRRGKPAVSSTKQPLKSLADIVKGKTGRFRQNLLGKRVDFSARSVIVVGPSLNLHECGIPKHMALNLFRPFVFNSLIKKGYAGNIKQARQKVDEPDAEVWDVLEEVIRQHPIMLNRAPTLHRLGIQAFEPVLIEGKAIQLHPLVCVAFNADFDGDQMAVHVPLSIEAQAETRILMLSSNNILSPANGEPVILPTQDIVFGIYYATRERIGAKGEGMRFIDLNEMSTALVSGAVDLQAKISVVMPAARIAGIVAKKKVDDTDTATDDDENHYEEKMLLETTVGRALMLFFLSPKLPFALINRTLKKKDLPDIVNESFRICGLRDTVIFCDNLMRFGFEQATRSGLSICMDDMTIPPRKTEIIARTEEEIQKAQRQFRSGLLTNDERYNKSVDLWDKAGEEISRIMMDELAYEPSAKGKAQESFNSLYMMADSGARGSQTQIKQLAGMRGLMTKSDGRIMETAITANFREGLSVLQYFLSAHGGRKGLTDTALKTANSGYLTRRLVDVAQDVVVKEDDCGTEEGIILRTVLMGSEVVVPLSKRVLGRYLSSNVLHPQTSQVLYPAGTYMTEEEAQHIADTGVDEVVVRSPVKCHLKHGLCVKCYGRDLGRGSRVQLGEAVGVIAAQSIGEPGTQLTMRTFHIGGGAQAEGVVPIVEAKTDGELRIVNNARVIPNARGEWVVVSRGGDVSIHDADGRGRERYPLQYGDSLKFNDKSVIKAGDVIFTRDSLKQSFITEYSGTVVLEGINEGINAVRQEDELTGVQNWVIKEDISAGSSRNKKFASKSKSGGGPRVKFLDDKDKLVRIPGTETEVSILLRPGTTLEVNDGRKVGAGDIIATMPRKGRKSRDITGGLPRVAELFEAREPKETSLLASAAGRVSLGQSRRSKQLLIIVDDKGKEHEHLIPKNRPILVQDGERVNRGDEIVEGDVNPHEILAMRGIEALTEHIVEEVQSVYRLQGVTISDKHIEVIVHQMLRCVVVTDGSDSRYLTGDQLVLSKAMEENDQLIEDGKKPLKYKNVLLGITKASLATDSFISAASFQETTRVLTEAAVAGKRDKLLGLKENVIVGKIIPAGTGFVHKEKEAAGDSATEEAEGILREELTDSSEAAAAAVAPDPATAAADQAAAAADQAATAQPDATTAA